jgi:hypothetical protein
MEQTITCPGCRYTFRIAKETFEKYKTGVSLKKKHEVTDGDAILLDCAGCGRVLKISITTWNVVGDGPVRHARGYEWVEGSRPRLVGEEPIGVSQRPTEGAGSAQEAPLAFIRLIDYGRIEKPQQASLSALIATLFFLILPVVFIAFDALLAEMAKIDISPEPPPIRQIVVPEEKAAAPSVDAEKKPADEPRLLTPVKEPTLFKDGNFEKMIKKYNKQIEDIEKQAEPAK